MCNSVNSSQSESVHHSADWNMPSWSQSLHSASLHYIDKQVRRLSLHSFHSTSSIPRIFQVPPRWRLRPLPAATTSSSKNHASPAQPNGPSSAQKSTQGSGTPKRKSQTITTARPIPTHIPGTSPHAKSTSQTRDPRTKKAP